MQQGHFPKNTLLVKARIWLHIMLTYMFMAAIVATLFCAYISEVNLLVISVSLALGGLYGSYKAEKVRNKTGLLSYSKKMASHQDLP